MSNIEKLVRPFQTKDTTPGRPLKTSETVTNDPSNAILSVGGSGQVKVYQVAYSHAVTCYMTKQERETKSKSGSGGTDLDSALNSVFAEWQLGLLSGRP